MDSARFVRECADEILSITCHLTCLEKDFCTRFTDLIALEVFQLAIQLYGVDQIIASQLHYKKRLFTCKPMSNSKLSNARMKSDVTAETRFR